MDVITFFRLFVSLVTTDSKVAHFTLWMLLLRVVDIFCTIV